MFDNIKDPNNPVPSDAQRRSPAPPNIPVSSVAASAEDIFSETLKDGAQIPGSVKSSTTAQVGLDNFNIENYDTSHRDKKKLLLLLLIFIGVIVIGYGAYFVFGRIVKNINQLKENSEPLSSSEQKEVTPVVEDLKKEAEEIPAPAVVEEKKVDETASSSVAQPVDVSNSSVNNAAAPADPSANNNLEAIATSTEMIDTDKDGLTDVEEKKLLTSPINIDSDNDGLNDFDEVKKYKTDPLKMDTDGDGFSDGEEVKAGYNPKGEGKLIK